MLMPLTLFQRKKEKPKASKGGNKMEPSKCRHTKLQVAKALKELQLWPDYTATGC